MTSVPYEQPPPRENLGRRLSRYFYRHPRLSLALLLALPLGWLVVAYLGSLFVLLLASVWTTDPFTSEVVHTYTFDNFRRIFDEPVYRDVAWRTIRMAGLVTIADAVLAFPIAYYMARVAIAAREERPGGRGADAAVGELPGEGLRVADDPLGRGRAELGARPARRLVRRLLHRRGSGSCSRTSGSRS